MEKSKNFTKKGYKNTEQNNEAIIFKKGIVLLLCHKYFCVFK